MSIYFIAFLLLGGFLILNMFVGVILENFNQAQEQEEQRQRDAIARGEVVEAPVKEAKPSVLLGDYYEQYGPMRRMVYDKVTSETFNSIIAAVIMSNVTIMAMEHYQPAAWFFVFMKIQNYVFSVIFFFEFVLKLTAYGWRYFFDGWCQFDFLLVLVSIMDVVLDAIALDLPINPTMLRILRVMRIARILRLMKGQWAEDLRKLLQTVANSLAQAGNLGLLLFLLYFIFACLGVELFGRMACTTANPCEGMNNKANFDHFFMALLVLFRLSTGDNWNGILKDALRDAPVDQPNCDFSLDCNGDNCCGGCDDSEDCKVNCCAGSGEAISCFYFTFFILAAQFVMLNLVVAVLMKELTDAEAEDKLLKEEQEAKEAESAMDVEAGGDEKSRRKSFNEVMKDGAKYWSRRLSNAHRPNNIMYDFPEKGEDAKMNNDVNPDESSAVKELVAVEGGGLASGEVSPASPPASVDANGVPTERPPTRSAWEST
jgi:hypothetical protein